MTDVLFEFYVGDTYTRDFKIDEYSRDIDNIYFSVKSDNTDKRTILQKKLDDGIVLTDIEYDGDKIVSRTYNLLIEADDTEDMKVDTLYPFDIEIISNATNGVIKKTIITGNINLISATTRKYNEG